MSKSALLEVLTDLNENRRLSFEVSELIEPFEGKAYALSFSLVSSSNTLGNRFGSEYNGGSTLICKLEGGSLEANVQTTPGEQAFVDGLVPEATFEMQVTLLDFDALYQRPIFGTIPEQTEAPEEPAAEAPDEPETAVSAEPVEKAEEPLVEASTPDDFAETLEDTPVVEEDMPVVEDTPVEEKAPVVEEIREPEEKDLRKERKKLIDQLSDTVGAWRTSSGTGAPFETKEEAEEKNREIYYEGEESEWGAASKSTPTPWEDSTSPVYTTEPEKKGCMSWSGCLKAVIVGVIVFFLMILFITLEGPEVKVDEGGDSRVSTTATLKSREDTYRPLALQALGKKRLNEEDRFYLRESAKMIWQKLASQYHENRDPKHLTAVAKMDLAGGYAWVALAAEADGKSARVALYENSRRKSPFHLLDDWFLIQAKVRVALRNPHTALDESDFIQVKDLDLSNEQLRDIRYLKFNLSALERLNLANNPIRDLMLLQEMKSLQRVTLTPSDSLLSQVDKLKKARPDLRIRLTGTAP